MSKRKTDWASTPQGRFLRWMRFGGEPMDDLLVERINGEQPENTVQETSDVAAHLLLREQDQKDAENEAAIAHDIQKWTSTSGKKIVTRIYALLSVVICLTMIFFLLKTVAAMPRFGDINAPTNNEVAARYLEKGIEETGAINFVAGMILDYRAFDTLGESTVLFIAACAVLILLRIDRNEDGTPTEELIAAEADDRRFEPKSDPVLQGSAKLLTPLVLLLGIYVILNGHLSPGGGFSGGSIIGAGLILYLNAFGFERASKFFTYKTFTSVSLLSLSFYALAKTYSFYCGANGLHSGIPLGTPGAILSAGLILPLNICVGMVVACTMYVFYTLFRKGGI